MKVRTRIYVVCGLVACLGIAGLFALHRARIANRSDSRCCHSHAGISVRLIHHVCYNCCRIHPAHARVYVLRHTRRFCLWNGRRRTGNYRIFCGRRACLQFDSALQPWQPVAANVVPFQTGEISCNPRGGRRRRVPYVTVDPIVPYTMADDQYAPFHVTQPEAIDLLFDRLFRFVQSHTRSLDGIPTRQPRRPDPAAVRTSHHALHDGRWAGPPLRCRILALSPYHATGPCARKTT